MKKLLIAAAAVATIGAAEAANVADYKATVKCVYMKQLKGIKINGQSVSPYMKYVGVTSLNGYVVYGDCACNDLNDLVDIKYSPAYLVVRSFAQTDNQPKIFPADLLIKMIDTRLGTAGDTDMIGAEGYLFAGAGKGSTFNNWDAFLWNHFDSADLAYTDEHTKWAGLDATGANLPENYNINHFGRPSFKGVAPWMSNYSYSFGFGSYATRLLFGQYNDADTTGYFLDSWLDHAGFGTAQWDFEAGGCELDQFGTCLEKLAGYLIGGEFICHPNGFPYGNYEWFRCNAWVGTTDVVAGYWTMKKNRTAFGVELSDEDGAFYKLFRGTLLSFNEYIIQKYGLDGRFDVKAIDREPGYYTDEDGKTCLYYPQYILDWYRWKQVERLLPFVKACVAHSTVKNLGFLQNVPAKFKDMTPATIRFLTMGGNLPGANDYQNLKALKDAVGTDGKIVYDVPTL